MVLIGTLPMCTEETLDFELDLDSGSSLAYVAPQKFSHLLATNNANGENGQAQWLANPRRKLSTTAKGATRASDEERWEGTLEFCQCLDNAVEIDHESDMFADKRVLELGFCTGLPLAFAFRNGAKSIHAHCWELSQLDNCVKPTLRRNNIPRNVCKFSAGDCEQFERTVQNQKFDVILAPELLCTDEAEFPQLHDLLENAVQPGGIILVSARPHYSDCSGNLPAFLDLLKVKGQFDAQIRWISTRSEVAPRKVVQMTRTIR